jgi:hypothetical protein
MGRKKDNNEESIAIDPNKRIGRRSVLQISNFLPIKAIINASIIARKIMDGAATISD